jgi:hypothetical protein
MKVLQAPQGPMYNTPNQVSKVIYGGGNSIQRFFFLKNGYVIPPVTDPETIPDYTLIWKYTVPTLSANEKKKQLVFKQQEYILPNFSGDGFPSVIYICCDGIGGYLDSTGAMTTRVAALVLTDLNPVLDST